jgi:ribulose-phosphate 3-epimerase
MQNVKIAPSILSADFSKMGEEVRSLQDNGADLVHCDVMDGVFVNNITFGIKMVEDLRKITTLPLDCHLMIVHPEKYVERFAKAGADIITVHYEACTDLAATIKTIKEHDVKAGVSVKPGTAPEVLDGYLKDLDLILVMSVEPGFGGQKFMDTSLSKIRYYKEKREELGCLYEIEVDGGISSVNAQIVRTAGADIIVAGSAVFKAADMAAEIRAICG